MTNPTLAELKALIKEPLDLEEETFIEDVELEALIMQSVREAEATVHDLYEDYFETEEALQLNEGEDEYDLPSDIYANKIRCVSYNDGSTKYEIKRFTGKLADLSLIESSEDYKYRLINPIGGYKLKLLPASRETSLANVTVYYIRNAATLSAETDRLDIPEATDFIVAKAQGLCLAKENGGVIPAAKQKEIDDAKTLMIQTLSDRFPDENTEIHKDTDIYESHS